ncbi:MAG: HAD-IIIA family hydrolase [Bacteroidetes bacterium]|nr:HAD-IIIA family hydrolase [Bacteroidota bacterium]
MKKRLLSLIKNIILDRDGVINEVVIRDSKVESPRCLSEYIIKEDFKRFHARIKGKDINLFVVSNQPDIARGKMHESELMEMNNLLLNSYSFKEIVYCIHDDIDSCDCRKPKPGMIDHLIKTYDLNRSEVIFIGDSWKDMEAGISAGIKTVFFTQEYNNPDEIKADYFVTSLLELIDLPIWE